MRRVLVASVVAVTSSLLMAGAASAIIYSPSSLTFTKQKVGTTSTPQQVSVGGGFCGPDQFVMMMIVPGPCYTEPTDIAVSGQFVITANTCPAALRSPTAMSVPSCTVSVAFAPTSLGPQQGFLRLASSAGVVGVPLSGTGCREAKGGNLKCAPKKKKKKHNSKK